MHLFALIIIGLLVSCGISSQKRALLGTANVLIDGSAEDNQAKSKCNQRGKIFDPVVNKVDCSETDIAKWSCTRDGLGARIKDVGVAYTDTIAKLDASISDGFVFRQCGEDRDGIILLLSKPNGFARYGFPFPLKLNAARWCYG